MSHRFTLLVCLLCITAGPVSAEKPFWPGTEYRQNIPTLSKVLGYETGEQITTPEDALVYLDALVAAAPEQAKLVEYAASWNGRPLKYLVISSAENMSQLADNQARTKRLMDPRQYPAAERPQLVAQTLPVSWLSYGVHGDEISSTDAALLTAYHLLGANDDPTVKKILADSIVVIDPVQNPDGRARFVAHFEQNMGLEPAVHYLAAEHRQPWPRARSNHYLFDMNRDWFALTQPESQGRVAVFQEFFPVVHADIHEMGVNQTYYFPPPTPPFNPHISEQQKRNLVLYGKGNASAFDDFGFDYFTREIFDAHYAGYGDTWPAFHGSIGMTFEVGSARGLVQRRDNGELVTYRHTIHQHFVASMGTMLTTATHGKRLLRDMAQYRAEALEGEEHYLFSGDPSLQKKLMANLVKQGIEVHQLTEAARVCGEPKPSGSYVVKAAQPAGHLVRTLLDADSPIAKEFWQDKERKRELGMSVDLYDVLAWSMPALYGLDVAVCQKSISGLEPAKLEKTSQRAWSNAQFAYLARNDTSASMSFLAAALRAGIEVRNVGAEFSIGDASFAAGTLLIKSADFNQAHHDQVKSLANQHDVDLIPLDKSWTDSGVNFGSDQVYPIQPPQIALAWDEPTYASAAGNTRFVIERALGYPTTTVRTAHLNSPRIDYFDVIILASGGDYASVLGESGVQRLKDWVSRGGVLITTGVATRLLISSPANLLASQLEANVETVESKPAKGRAPASTIDSEDEYLAILSESATRPDFVPGVIARGQSDEHHYLADGVADTLYFLIGGSDIYTPLKQGQGTNVVRFADESELLHGGYLWEENRAQMAYKPVVMADELGEGTVIGFVIDPAFRGYMDGFHVLLGNAIFKAASR
jgi:hypothetical protein